MKKVERLIDNHQPRMALQILDWFTLKLLRNPRARRLVECHYRWQPISPTTGEPLGRGIVVVEGNQGFNIPLKLAADGRWLAEAGDRLWVWQVPMHERYQRKLWTLLAALIPWLLLLRRRRGLSANSRKIRWTNSSATRS